MSESTASEGERAFHLVICLPAETAARLSSVLTAKNHRNETLTVTDPSQLAAALSGDVDLVVCGATLPGLGPVDTARAITASGRAVELVVYLDERSDAALETAVEAGAVDVLDAADLARWPLLVSREVSRRRARDSRVIHAELYEKIIDAIPFILFAKDAEHRRLVVANQTFATTFKVTKEWLMGKLDHDYFPKEQADSFIAIDTEILETKQMKTFEEVVRVGTEDFIYRTRKLPLLDDRGEARYVLGITEDVTPIRRAEEELKRSRELSAKTLASYQRRALQMEIIRQQNEDLDRLAAELGRAKRVEEERARELEAAARLKSEFLANFSHEIRTPLNAILGYCDLVVREEGQRLTPHGRRDLGVIKQNAKTLLALINDILDLSKMEAGHADIVRERVNVQALVEECCSAVRETLRNKDVKLVSEVAHDAREAFTDSLKLRQILLNLLSNASKFTDTGEIVATLSAEGETLVARIEDTGSGIPADQLPFIFEKFRQVDGSPSRRVGGTGLGLAIVREVAQVLSGTVNVTSTLGRGSTFEVRLPGALGGPALAPVKQAAAPKEGSTTPAPLSTVLIIDDDPMVHQLLRGRMQQDGFEVLSASDGVEGLTLAREHRPTVILLDLHLPKLDGWGVLARLKSEPQLAVIPVIIVSVEEERARGFSFGACDYLIKPVEADQLINVVRRSIRPGTGEVLIIDDDAHTRELVTRSLRKVGFTTIEAANGEEGLLHARSTSPSMVILDLLMPGMDGFEVLRTLRAEGSTVPILVLTGKNLDATERAVLESGLARVITKNGVGIDQVVGQAMELVSARRVVEQVSLPRILYVEDTEQNLDLVRRYVAGTFVLLEAGDGEEGLERAAREMPDLILMDLSLPRLNGWDATRRLKADPALRHIPVIAVSAHAGTEERARAKDAGCIDYVTKPIDRDELIGIIRKFLGARHP
ncbi:MAG: sensory box histidine kinase/response regulator [Labilithrix sp.]|nr:sensory box histidine kinase/response regulator [Labilithrix sp.]